MQVFVSDHGESFGEGRSLGHGERLTTQQIHVPLVIVSPRVAAGRSDVPVGSVDVAATLESLAGGDRLPGAGRDLTADPARWRAEQPVVGMRRTFAEPYEDVRTDGSIEMVDGHRFYFVAGELAGGVAVGREYTGNADGIAANDGHPVAPELRERLLALFERFSAELDGTPHSEQLDPETQRALEALGYTR